MRPASSSSATSSDRSAWNCFVELVPNARLIAFVINPHSKATAAQVDGHPGRRRGLWAEDLGGECLNARKRSTLLSKPWRKKTLAQFCIAAHQFYQIVRNQLVARAAQYRLPAMYEWREFVEAGGLANYSTDRIESFRQMGLYAGQNFKGVKPSDLPVIRPTKFESVINLKTAKALGLMSLRPCWPAPTR